MTYLTKLLLILWSSIVIRRRITQSIKSAWTVRVRSNEDNNCRQWKHTIRIQINHQLDAIISPVFHLTFIYGSTCYGCPHAHHQELNNCSSSLWFYLRSVVIAVLLVDKPTGPTTTNSTATTTIRRYNQRLLLQVLISWWWAWGSPKHVEL